MKFSVRVSLALAAAMLLAARADAANIYNITQSQSQLDLSVSGTFLGGTLTVAEQQAGAVTRYNGTMDASFPGGPNVGGSIAFPGGGSANAVNPTSGFFNLPVQYSPKPDGAAGTAAANYGVNISAPVGISIPTIPIPVGGSTVDLNLGTLSSFTMTMAIRNLELDVTSSSSMAIGPGGQFDVAGSGLSVVSGFADINGSLVFTQPDVLSTLAAAVALNALVGAYPQLGLTVTQDLLGKSVSLGIGSRLDLSTASGTSLPNTSLTPGSVSYVNQATSSTLILPMDAALPGLSDLGIPTSLLDLQLSLSGQLRGTGMITEIPEPSSIVLGSLASGCLGLIGLRRRRRQRS